MSRDLYGVTSRSQSQKDDAVICVVVVRPPAAVGGTVFQFVVPYAAGVQGSERDTAVGFGDDINSTLRVGQCCVGLEAISPTIVDTVLGIVCTRWRPQTTKHDLPL